jgi:hypothetical protein
MNVLSARVDQSRYERRPKNPVEAGEGMSVRLTILGLNSFVAGATIALALCELDWRVDAVCGKR